jgi:hypothetical protein
VTNVYCVPKYGATRNSQVFVVLVSGIYERLGASLCCSFTPTLF